MCLLSVAWTQTVEDGMVGEVGRREKSERRSEFMGRLPMFVGIILAAEIGRH